MYYSDELVEEIRQRNDIVDVISSYVKLQRKGASHFGLCPFHNEKSPSFSVTQGKQMYYCFGCGEGGNVFTFIMKYENYTFVEALQFLADRAGISLPEAEYSQEEKRAADIRNVLLDIHKKAARYFYYQLKNEKGKQAYDYLKKRELSDETILKFGLGYSNKTSNDLYQYLKQEGYSDEILKDSGLVTIREKGTYDKFWNRVMFPIMDLNNRVIGFGGRVMGEGEPKYLNSQETRIFDKSRNLYGLNLARLSKRNHILICEGYMDVIALHQAGFNHAVASLGTAFTSGHASLMKRYTNQVILSFDSDTAGIRAALRAIPILREAGLDIKVLTMEPYKDPDEFIKALGAEAYEERIQKAKNAFLFEIEQLQKNYDMKDPDEKTRFYQETAKKLMEFPDEIKRNNYIEVVSREYMIPSEMLVKLVNTLALTGQTIREKPKPSISKVQKEDGWKQSQRLLLTWLIEEPEIFEKISPYVTEEDFIEPLYHRVASLLWQQLESGQLNPAQIVNQFVTEEEHKEVAALFNTTLEGLSATEKEREINDIVYRVKKKSLDNKKKSVKDIKEMQDIINRQKELQKIHIGL